MKQLKAILPCLLLVWAACGDKPAPQPTISPDVNLQATPAISRPLSSADVVKASVAGSEVAAGGGSEAKVLIGVSQGYHVNANPPAFPYLIPTTLEPATSEGITFSKPIYPAPLTKTFSFAEKPLVVYEGEAAIKLPLQAAATAAKGARNVPLKVRVQACDDAACYAPATLNLTLSLTVK